MRTRRARCQAGWVRNVIPVGLLAAVAACGDPVEFRSNWREHDVVIDGEGTDWTGALTDFPKERISAGAMNDSEYLYVTVRFSDERRRRQVVMHGLTLWFDSEGGDDQRFGIRYPLGRMSVDPQRRNAGEFGANAAGRDKVEILRSEERPARIPISDAVGIEVSVQPQGDVLVYELKVPLAETPGHTFAIGTAPGRSIGVGIVVAGMDPEMRKRMEGRRSGGGGRRGGGRGGPPGAGNPERAGRSGAGRGRPEPPKPLEVWARVTLQPPPPPAGG